MNILGMMPAQHLEAQRRSKQTDHRVNHSSDDGYLDPPRPRDLWQSRVVMDACAGIRRHRLLALFRNSFGCFVVGVAHSFRLALLRPTYSIRKSYSEASHGDDAAANLQSVPPTYRGDAWQIPLHFTAAFPLVACHSTRAGSSLRTAR